MGSFQVHFWGALTHEYCSLYVKACAVIIKAVRVTVVVLLWYKQERRLLLHAHYANKRGGNCPCYALSGELCPLVWLWPLNGCDWLICDTEMVGAPCVKVTLLEKQRCSPALPSRPNVSGPWLLALKWAGWVWSWLNSTFLQRHWGLMMEDRICPWACVELMPDDVCVCTCVCVCVHACASVLERNFMYSCMRLKSAYAVAVEPNQLPVTFFCQVLNVTWEWKPEQIALSTIFSCFDNDG